MSAPTDPVLHLALRDLMRTHAPGATLLAAVGQRVLNIRADGPLQEQEGAELVPPDDWLAHGDLAWITRDGALLGLLWSEDAPVPAGAVQVLTLLLSAASVEGANREADMLITQLPAPTAWLSADLNIRQVSRTFMEMFGISGEIVGKALTDVLPSSASFAGQLAGAAAGRSVRLKDEFLAESGRWVRGEAKPYFGGAAAGVLWTVQDVTPEYRRSAQMAALLDVDAPVALVTSAGTVLQASRGLQALAAGLSEDGSGAPIWTWPCFTEEASGLLQELIRGAATGNQAELNLVGGAALSLSARHSELYPESIILEGPQRGAASSGVVSQVLSLSDAATILLDHAGRTQLISEQAATLLELDPKQMVGLGLARIAQQLGIKLYTPEGQPLPMPELKNLPLPLTREILLSLPAGMTRHMEVRATRVEASSPSKKAGMLLTFRDLTTLRRTEAKLRHDAVHDPLTGLLNRAGLRSLLSNLAVGPAELSGMVASLDLDGFGALNAALGRTAGDLLLIQVAARLNDLAADLGGRAARLADDSFAIYLPEVSAEVGGGKLQAALQEPLRAGRRLVPVTFSIGTAPLSSPPDQALTDSEMALLHAKRGGRAGLQLFNASLRDHEAQSFELENDLQHALEGGQFTLLYQPAVSLKNGRAISAEALLRWTHPTLGNISPARFIPLASRSDLITSIGEWVVREAGKGRATIREATGQSDWRTSVNLSLEELRRAGAASRLLPLVTKQNALDIEVSAGSLIDHSSETLEVLESLKAKGSRLIVDDFGDSASSLTALTRFPLSGVKLHPTLTARLPDDELSLKLVQGTVSLAHSLGLAVTAVGVETYAQLDVLRDLGCDAAQGYALTPPLSAEDLTVWLKSRAFPAG